MKVNPQASTPRPRANDFGRVPQGDVIRTGPNTFQTHRYRIEVEEGGLRIYDLKTKTFVDADLRSHLSTSDGDKMNFGAQNLTLDLEDGTKVTLKADPDMRGLSTIEGMHIMTEKGGVEVTNINGAGQPRARMVADSAALDRKWADGTVLEPRGEIDDLHFKCGKEIVGGDPSQAWGEHQIAGARGRSDISFDQPISSMDVRELRRMLSDGSLRRMRPDQLRQVIDRIDELLSEPGPRVRDHRGHPRARVRDHRGGRRIVVDRRDFGETFPPLMKLRRHAVSRFAASSRGSDSFVDGIKGQVNSLNGKISDLQDKIKNGEVDKDQLPFVQLELQELMQQRRQLIDMATNIARSEHEERMSVLRNLRL